MENEFASIITRYKEKIMERLEAKTPLTNEDMLVINDALRVLDRYRRPAPVRTEEAADNAAAIPEAEEKLTQGTIISAQRRMKALLDARFSLVEAHRTVRGEKLYKAYDGLEEAFEKAIAAEGEILSKATQLPWQGS